MESIADRLVHIVAKYLFDILQTSTEISPILNRFYDLIYLSGVFDLEMRQLIRASHNIKHMTSLTDKIVHKTLLRSVLIIR